MRGEDRDLGMGRAITRRDFVQGIAVAGVAGGIASGASAREAAMGADNSSAATYPPLRSGMRGAHPGSFESVPGVHGGTTFPSPERTGEIYDLVVVGGGLSGLAAACFYRQRAGTRAKILVLDNHDDFGGHAKRNEFTYKGRNFITSGGSDYLVAPPTWTREAQGLLDDLGVDWKHPLHERGLQTARKLQPATFFPKEVYGRDKLIIGATPQAPTPAFLAQIPVSAQVKKDLAELMTGTTDYLAGMTPDQKIAKLRAISYRDYLLNIAKLHPDVLAYTQGVWCLGNDLASAWFAYFRYKPGFAGLGLKRPDGSPESPEREALDYHLPGGNADVARLMVRSLIPDALAAGGVSAVETKRVNYAVLDVPGAATRIRLSSIVVRAQHTGSAPPQFEPDTRDVEVSYVKDGKLLSVIAKNVVMACMNNVVPYICPEIPESQKRALHAAVRAVNQETNVLFRDWRPFAKLGISGVSCPNAFYGSFGLSRLRLMGDMEPVREPSEPIVVYYSTGANSGILSNPTMLSTLTGGHSPAPGTAMDDQFRACRAGLLQTPFETFERAVRDQTARALAGTGFDPARDIVAITVNRWPHGFATGRNILFDATSADDPSPTIAAKQKWGRITICNSDASGQGLAQTAISEAWRAVSELEPRAYGYFETF